MTEVSGGAGDRKEKWEAFADCLSRRMELGPKLGDELSRDMDGDHSSPTAK
jgi:hypothetical protein